MKILDTFFTNNSILNLENAFDPILLVIGIVLCENEVGQITCRIGACDETGNLTQTAAEFIAATGAKLNMPVAIAFFPEKKELITANWKKN